MFTPLLRAIEQLDDPVFLGVVVRSLALSFVAFVALLGASVDGVAHLVGAGTYLGWLAGALGGTASVVLAVWLFVPAAVVIATLFINRVAVAVERRYYAGLQQPRGAPLHDQIWDGVALGLRVLGWQVVALVVAIAFPGVGFVVGYVVSGWAIGRGLFVSVAMRRMPREQALELYRAKRAAVVLPGIALAVAATVPIINLFVPVLAIAAMVHVSHQPARLGYVSTFGR